MGFGPQTQKLESPYKTPSNTLAVKGLRMNGMLRTQFDQALLDLLSIEITRVWTICHVKRLIFDLCRPYSVTFGYD